MSNDALRLHDYLSHIAQAIERIDTNLAGLDKDAWMRNVLAHGYFRVDLDIVWQTITVDLHLLLPQIRTMLD
jgi:uncharacterized protein with HEPN domain